MLAQSPQRTQRNLENQESDVGFWHSVHPGLCAHWAANGRLSPALPRLRFSVSVFSFPLCVLRVVCAKADSRAKLANNAKKLVFTTIHRDLASHMPCNPFLIEILGVVRAIRTPPRERPVAATRLTALISDFRPLTSDFQRFAST